MQAVDVNTEWQQCFQMDLWADSVPQGAHFTAWSPPQQCVCLQSEEGTFLKKALPATGSVMGR